ncbi:MAG: hypothetical protein ACFFA3_16135 [Promethearchaeota archaeon]
MNYIYLFICFILFNGFFMVFLFFDLKHRMIPSNVFKLSYIITISTNIFEYFLFFKHFSFFFLSKIFIFFVVFFFSLLLFLLKIIGGGDGKLLIFIFNVHPLQFLNLALIFTFFSIFSCIYIIIFISNLINNYNSKRHYSFFLYYNLNTTITGNKKLFINTFYKFINYSELEVYNEEKSLIKSLDLVYNVKLNKIQILCQIRPPLIVDIILSYYFIFCLILVI